ncbi:MAG TPA: CPBP family intramembrane glutamic endopeptidase [Kofleriaceae bacterium]|nr:CPBP family intramembrane glutamic endopeptidase [Kofleriaceae bacterium]
MKKASRYGHGDLAASFVLIVPLLLVYEVGVLFAGRVNGADVITRAVYGALGRTTYLLVYAAIAVGFLIWIRRGHRWASLRLDVVAPVFLEAAIYALTLGALLTLLVDRVLGMGITSGELVNALGAGVHEELVFRLGLLCALVTMFRQTRIGFVLAIAISSVVFSLAHHVGTHGEPFTMHAFVYRSFAGAAFALIFWFRSLAHVVYAHVLYDVLVYWRT